MSLPFCFRWFFFAAIFSCAWGAGFCQTQPSASSTISGTVVNSVTGEPIRGALVQVVGSKSDAVLSDGDGRFEFDDVPAQRSSVVAHKPGFLNDIDIQATYESQSIAVQPSSPSTPLVVKLTPQAVISGRAQDEAGEAIEDLPVKLIYLHVVEGRKRWEQHAITSTDPDGGFRFADLTPGLYYVKAGPSTVGALGARQEDAFGAAFYPGAPGPDGTSPVRVAAGEKMQADFSLKSEPVFKVSGVVAGLTQGQGIGLQVFDEFGDVVATPTEMGPGAGTFQLRVPGGTYSIRAWIQGPDGVQKAAEQTVRVQSDISTLRLLPVASPTIPVRIRTEFTSKSSRVVQAAGRPFQAATIRLVPQGPALANNDVYAGARFAAGQSPELTFQNIPSGRYMLAVNPNGNWYVQSARWGDVDALQDEINISAGGSLPPLEIVLRDDGGSINGTVESDGSQTRCQVLLVRDRNRSQIRTETLGSGAQFDFANLPPDDYSVLALDNAETLQYADPGALDSYLSNAVHVTVAANGRQSVNVKLTRVGKP
jgi:hypothetical protein